MYDENIWHALVGIGAGLCVFLLLAVSAAIVFWLLSSNDDK